ncbi:aminotransferase class I/II-fold pyridoxal phosphate-dependent enzyme [uncultured Hyphomonas sp.]|uniref:aminotransferase class I/II-fold pyridoxal phosphate-dependent enzyme n=1 Tax=uncultured Hyphomonas sp. TaxID=225298 RepID=UPI003748D326
MIDIELSAKTAAMTCAQGDALFAGLEKALDNGRGFVFVTDAAGKLAGYADLAIMRGAFMKGGHLSGQTVGDVAVAWGSAKEPLGVEPVLDGEGRLTGIDESGPQPFLPVSEPDLTHREMRNAFDAFMSTWISSTGDYIRRFEQEFAEKVGMAHGVATSNGTVSLHLAMATLGIGEGDEVIVPDLTFAASINTVMHVGARPVLVDVDRDTWCLSAEAVERAITPRTRAIMPVHVFGRPSQMTEIAELAKAYGLYIIEDCAEAHGAKYDGQPIGSFSDISSFSFFANKIITTGEGGICLTNDADIATRMRMLRDHGMRPERRYWHEEPGFNFRMTNMQAAIGCAQIERMDELLAMRADVYERYVKALSGIPGVTFPPAMDQRAQPVTWFACAQVPEDKRAELIAACKAANIDLRPFFHGLSSMPAYRQYARKCPNSTWLSRTGVNLPTSRRVDDAMVARIAGVFESVLGKKA